MLTQVNTRVEGKLPPVAFDQVPAGFDPLYDIPRDFLDFLLPFHREFTPRQQALAAKRAEVLARSYQGRRPDYLPPSVANTVDWRIDL
jgi:hypothetical protein